MTSYCIMSSHVLNTLQFPDNFISYTINRDTTKGTLSLWSKVSLNIPNTPSSHYAIWRHKLDKSDKAKTSISQEIKVMCINCFRMSIVISKDLFNKITTQIANFSCHGTLSEENALVYVRLVLWWETSPCLSITLSQTNCRSWTI